MDDIKQEELVDYYKQAYEREKQRNAELTDELADAIARATDAEWHLNHIKSNPLWKLSKPFRMIMHFFIRNYQRLMAYGNPRGIAHKLKSKMRKRMGVKLK